MTVAAADPLQYMRIRMARVVQLVGWPGVAGVALLVVALSILATAWSTHDRWVHAQVSLPAPSVQRPGSTAEPASPILPDLPAAAEIPQLLKQMEQAATQNGLEWRSAEYRIVAATASMPGSLEVRCGITGPYPKLRGMLVQLIRSVPAFSIREFNASRSTAESIDVDAKLVLAVFLRDESAIATAPNEVPR